MSYLINPITRLFDFRTRSSRREYWLYLLWMLPFYALVTGLTASVSASALSDPSGAADVSTASTLALISGIVYVLLALPLPALFVRRMQDTGGTGWLLLVPTYGAIRMALFRGEAGANRFGNPPTR